MRKHFKKRVVSFLAALCICFCATFGIIAEASAVPIQSDEEETSDVGVPDGSLGFDCKSVILMEEKTGTVLYKQDAELALPPASVTKIMTLLLVMEAIESGCVLPDTRISISANAASMGGSQVYLKEGEVMTVEELLKSVIIASANDAAVALAEHISGSVSAFVEKMNARAEQLGMKNTHFENVTGLDDTAERHVTSAKDIAIMSRELIRHDLVLKYSSIWMDSIRNGEFGLTNTNRLVRFYQGCTGLKTGSTAKAGFCVSVTAKRESLSLICVVMGAESRDARNAIATQLLDWGFATYALYQADAEMLSSVKAIGGAQSTCKVGYASFCCVLPKSEIGSVETKISLPESVTAPVTEGDEVGSVELLLHGKPIGTVPITASETVKRIGYFEILWRMLSRFLLI